jgi:hypothetical protein
VTDLARVNEFHRDAFERANRQPQVAMSILAHQLVQALEAAEAAERIAHDHGEALIKAEARCEALTAALREIAMYAEEPTRSGYLPKQAARAALAPLTTEGSDE